MSGYLNLCGLGCVCPVRDTSNCEFVYYPLVLPVYSLLRGSQIIDVTLNLMPENASIANPHKDMPAYILLEKDEPVHQRYYGISGLLRLIAAIAC
jgi:hypothetical protein